MSHTCPDCGETCSCHGDIDDCEMNTEQTYIDCAHGCQFTQLHDKHCRVRNDASIRPEYEKAYCTCKHRYPNAPDLVERTNREISQLKMVSPETARLLLADNARLRKAIQDAPCPRCECPNELPGHTKDCGYALYHDWKRKALAPKP